MNVFSFEDLKPHSVWIRRNNPPQPFNDQTFVHGSLINDAQATHTRDLGGEKTHVANQTNTPTSYLCIYSPKLHHVLK